MAAESRCRLTDEALVKAAREGAPAAFAPIIARYREAVFAVALSRLWNFHDAEDVAQEVFVEAHARLGGLKDPARLGAWLRSIAIHRAIDALRRRRETADLEKVDEGAVKAWREKNRRTEVQGEVMARIAALGSAERETTALFYIDGYTVDQVAAIQEVPPGTVKRRLHDARRRLREEMVAMVEDVLKAGAPGEDFARRVFEILSQRASQAESPYAHERWNRTVAELQKIGARGFEGFARALESPYSATRVFTMNMLSRPGVSQKGEAAVELLKKALADPNRKVRRWAAEALLLADAADSRKQSEFVPLVVPLLVDHSIRVRRAAAWSLVEFAPNVPLEAIVNALLAETDHHTRRLQKNLLHAATHGGERKWYPE